MSARGKQASPTYESFRKINVGSNGRILFSPSGKILAHGDVTGVVRIFNLDGIVLYSFDNSGGRTVTSLCWVGLDDRQLLSGHMNGQVAYVRVLHSTPPRRIC